jgi:hypothetical protein
MESEMGFAAGAVAGMSFVQMRFILHVEAFGCESREQFRRDDVLHSHG